MLIIKLAKKISSVLDVRLNLSRSSVSCVKMTSKISDKEIDECFIAASDLVHKAGALVRMKNETRTDFKLKANDIDLVTETDKAVEKLIIEGLKEKFPTHKFIGEEQTADGATSKLDDEPTWIIDPIDGTMNFVHSFPHSCISVGLSINKQPEIGIIYNPLLNQLFTARRNQGAYYNGRRTHVSNQKDLRLSLITTEFGTTRDPEKMCAVYENMQKIVENSHGVRMLGSAALNMAMVALGAVDANFEYGIHAWDVCAGAVIVKEAGGVVLDPSGGPFDIMSRRVLATATPELAYSIVDLVTQYYPKPRDDAD